MPGRDRPPLVRTMQVFDDGTGGVNVGAMFNWLLTAIVALLSVLYWDVRGDLKEHKQRITALEVAHASIRAAILEASNQLRDDLVDRLELIATLLRGDKP